MKKSFLSFVFLSFCALYGFGQVTISGRYTGENVFISNPALDEEATHYCTKQIVINGKEYDGQYTSKSFEIKLDELKLTVGDSIKIEIFHHEGCEPKMLNKGCLYVPER